VPPPHPASLYPRAECNGPWLDTAAHLALPEGDAARRNLWETLAAASLPPPYRECAAGAQQTDVPQTDFGLGTSRPAPADAPVAVRAWASERPELSPLLLPAIQSSEQAWLRGEGTYEHTFTTTHWIGAIKPETLASFDRLARVAELRLDAVERDGLAFMLRYESKAALVRLRRVSRTELELEIVLTLPGDLRTVPSVAAALAERPVASLLAERATLRRVRERGPRRDFFFVRDPRHELAHTDLLPATCPARRSKGADARRCFSDARSFVITDGARLDVLDEPHDLFE
jgi:hypothetical protein